MSQGNLLRTGARLSSLLVAVAGLACAATFNPGGVTFPMEEISARRFAPTGDERDNLLDNRQLAEGEEAAGTPGAWRSGTWIFKEKNRKAFEAAARRITRAAVAAVDGGKALELDRPAALEDLMGDEVPCHDLNFTQVVRLPDQEGGAYRLSLESRARLVGKRRHDHMVLVYFLDGSDPRPGRGKDTRGYLYSHIPDAPDWHPHSIRLAVPSGTRDLMIILRADGCGRLLIRSPRLVRLAAAPQPLSVVLAPGRLLDDTYALGSGDPGLVSFKFRNNLPKGKLPRGGYVFNLELPEAVAVKGTNIHFGETLASVPVVLDGRPARRWQTSCDPIVGVARNSQDFVGWQVPAVMILSQAAAGTRWRGCRYYVTREGRPASAVETFDLVMIPRMERVAPPRRFLGGFSSVDGDLRFHQPEATALLAEFIAGTGSTLIAGAGGQEQRALLRRKGVRLLTAEAGAFANGYRIGRVDKDRKPAYSFYRDREGKPVVEGYVCSTCPTAIYNRTPYFQEVVVPQLREALQGLDGLQPNWEPFMFRARGCFCDNCRDEFARFAGLSPEKAKEIWPGQLLPGCPYRDQGIRFRAQQHARMIRTLHETAVELGAGAVGFCPEVGTDQVIRYPEHFAEQGEFSPYEYAGGLEWLNVWGPYVWFLADQPYNHVKGSHLVYLEYSRRVIRDYRRHFKDPARRARLMAMPHGNQSGLTALGQPEGLAMDQLSAFLAGYDASELYFFPRGYDHRFWQQLARTNRLTAAHEDLVMDGRRLDAVTAVPTTPFPAAVESIAPRMLPDVRRTELLQTFAFGKGEDVLVAVGNFWEKGDVVCRLRIPGLASGRPYQVLEREFRRWFVRDGGAPFSGRELADGILLHVGALRWAFFDVVPLRAIEAPGEKVPAGRMRQEQERCRKDNLKAGQAEAARDKALHAENDVGELQELEAGRLACRPFEKDGRRLLRVASGDGACLVVDPRGMTLDAWNDGAADLATPDCALSAFWTPGENGMVAELNYHVTDQKLTAEGFRITGDFTTSTRSYPKLAGLQVVKTIAATPDLRTVTVSVKLHNTQAEAMNDIGYRWRLFPTAWSNRTPGVVRCAGAAYRRPGTFGFWRKDCDPDSEKEIRRLFQVGSPTVPIGSGEFRIEAPSGSPLHLSLLPADQLAGIAIWDTPGMVAATFEPCYRKTTIPPGGTVQYSIVFRYPDGK